MINRSKLLPWELESKSFWPVVCSLLKAKAICLWPEVSRLLKTIGLWMYAKASPLCFTLARLVRDQVLRRDSTRRPYFGSVGIIGLTQISRLCFKQSRISPHISLTYLCYRLFCKFWGDFWVYLGTTVFLKGLETFMKMGNLEDLMLF